MTTFRNGLPIEYSYAFQASLSVCLPASHHAHRVDEVFLQVVEGPDHPAVQRRAHPEVVEDRQVLHVLAEPTPPACGQRYTLSIREE